MKKKMKRSQAITLLVDSYRKALEYDGDFIAVELIKNWRDIISKTEYHDATDNLTLTVSTKFNDMPNDFKSVFQGDA